jgi:hypothetical protein
MDDKITTQLVNKFYFTTITTGFEMNALMLADSFLIS